MLDFISCLVPETRISAANTSALEMACSNTSHDAPVVVVGLAFTVGRVDARPEYPYVADQLFGCCRGSYKDIFPALPYGKPLGCIVAPCSPEAMSVSSAEAGAPLSESVRCSQLSTSSYHDQRG